MAWPTPSIATPYPPYINDGNAYVSARISPGTNADMMNPNPDPGEEYQHVNTQLFGVVDPPDNQFRAAGDMLPPYNNPSPGQPATMMGFVQDYCNNFVATMGRNPTFDEYRVIMDSFGPQQLPVLSTLAREFAVYDAWFCSVPSQTATNRSFFHASTASGYTVNVPYTKWITTNDGPTIFNRLQDAGLTWRVYYDETQIVPMTALIHAPVLFPYWKTNFATMTDFYNEVANGTLPTYAFVEPRMIFNNNDFHPPAPSIVIPTDPPIIIGGTSDVRNGDLLVHEIYSAVRTSAATNGSNALNTLLLLTFDEHGGCFDHVVPPPAVPPERHPTRRRKGVLLRPPGCPGSHNRHFGVHGGQYRRESPSASCRRRSHIVPEVRPAASHRARSERARPLQRLESERCPTPFHLARDDAAAGASAIGRDRPPVAHPCTAPAERSRAAPRRPGDGVVQRCRTGSE